MSKSSSHSRKDQVGSLEENLGLDEWAKALVASIGKKAARSILEDYRALSKSTKVTKKGRDIAAKRVSAIRKIL